MEAVKQSPDFGMEAEEGEVEEAVSLHRKRFRQNSNSAKTYEDGRSVQPMNPAQYFDDAEDTGLSYGSSGIESPNLTISDIAITHKTGKIIMEKFDIQHVDDKVLPLLLKEQSVKNDHSTNESRKKVCFTDGISEHGRVESRKEIEKEVGELYLERVYDKPGSHNFYCPNCNSCITKVIIRDREWESKLVSEQCSVPAGTFRCTSCFSFLVPIGNWFFPKLVSPAEEDPTELDAEYYVENAPANTLQKPKEIPNFRDASTNNDPVSSPPAGANVEKETTISIVGVGTVIQSQESMEIQHDQSESKNKEPFSDQKVEIHITVSKDPTEIEISTVALAPLEEVIIDGEKKHDDTSTVNKDISEQKGPISITVISGTTEMTTSLEPSSESKRWQILKSIVYGGLVESITSLGIVTSAASADAKTPNIVVLALANLIGGFFVIGHNLRDLKNDQFKRSKNEAEEQLDRYEEALGEREHMVLHFSIVILSFLVFGLIPPLVYGLSFRESDNRDFKIAAVAGASLLCISLLALGKAHIQKPSRWQKYITIVIYYLGIGIGVSGLSYLAGDLIGMLIDKLGWFKSSSEAVLFLPRMDLSEPGFGSY